MPTFYSVYNTDISGKNNGRLKCIHFLIGSPLYLVLAFDNVGSDGDGGAVVTVCELEFLLSYTHLYVIFI